MNRILFYHWKRIISTHLEAQSCPKNLGIRISAGIGSSLTKLGASTLCEKSPVGMDGKLNLSSIRLSEMKVRTVILNSHNGHDSFKELHSKCEVPHIPITIELEELTTPVNSDTIHEQL